MWDQSLPSADLTESAMKFPWSDMQPTPYKLCGIFPEKERLGKPYKKPPRVEAPAIGGQDQSSPNESTDSGKNRPNTKQSKKSGLSTVIDIFKLKGKDRSKQTLLADHCNAYHTYQSIESLRETKGPKGKALLPPETDKRPFVHKNNAGGAAGGARPSLKEQRLHDVSEEEIYYTKPNEVFTGFKATDSLYNGRDCPKEDYETTSIDRLEIQQSRPSDYEEPLAIYHDVDSLLIMASGRSSESQITLPVSEERHSIASPPEPIPQIRNLMKHSKTGCEMRFYDTQKGGDNWYSQGDGGIYEQVSDGEGDEDLSTDGDCTDAQYSNPSTGDGRVEYYNLPPVSHRSDKTSVSRVGSHPERAREPCPSGPTSPAEGNMLSGGKQVEGGNHWFPRGSGYSEATRHEEQIYDQVPNEDDDDYEYLCTDGGSVNCPSSMSSTGVDKAAKTLSDKTSQDLTCASSSKTTHHESESDHWNVNTKISASNPADLSDRVRNDSSKKKPPVPTPRTIKRHVNLQQAIPDIQTHIHSIPSNLPESSRPTSRELPEIQALMDDKAWKSIKSSKDRTKFVLRCGPNFVGRSLDKKGGRLQLKSYGVTLVVPPGALGESPVMVYIYVPRSLELSPPGGDGFASPVVHCGTSGLKFNLPVTLTFPVHVKDPSQWELSGVRQNSSTSPWEEISESSSDSLVLVKDGLCTMIVDHFTGFGLAARPKEPRGASRPTGSASGAAQGVLPLRVGVFLPKDRLGSSGKLQLRLRIWDESEETTEIINKAEKHSEVLDTTRKLFLRTPCERAGNRHRGLDVTVAIRSLNERWTSSPMEQTIPWKNIRLDPRGHVEVSLTFNLKFRSRSSSRRSGFYPLECDFVIGQKSQEDLAVIIRAISDIKASTGTENREFPVSETVAVDGVPNPMSATGYNNLCLYLDGEKRWKNLADHVFGSRRGCYFDSWPFPSTALLNAIFSRIWDEGAPTKDTLNHLCDMLRDSKLPGAEKIVRKEIGDGSSHILKMPTQCTEDGAQEYTEVHVHRSALPRYYGENEVVYEVSPMLMPGHIAQASCVRRDRQPEENDEEPDQIHTLVSNTHQLQVTSPPRPGRPVATQQQWPPEDNCTEVHVHRSARPRYYEQNEVVYVVPPKLMPDHIAQASCITRDRQLEENDEAPDDQIHTLVSNTHPHQLHLSRAGQGNFDLPPPPPRPGNPVATRQQWPPEDNSSPRHLTSSTPSNSGMEDFGEDCTVGLQLQNIGERQLTAVSNSNDTAYHECEMGMQPQTVENTEHEHYVNTEMIRRPAAQTEFPKGYVKLHQSPKP